MCMCVCVGGGGGGQCGIIVVISFNITLFSIIIAIGELQNTKVTHWDDSI